MKAVTFNEYGAPSQVLQFKEVEKPSPKSNEVLVKIYASSINDGDNSMISGSPFIARASSGLFKPKYVIPGGDIAGKVEAVGSNITKFQIGDKVFGDLGESGFGAFAEYVSVPEDVLSLKPVNISYDEAAAAPQYAVVVLQSLRDFGHIGNGDKVIINGASGGIGTFAVQIAKSYGAEVTGVCSAKNSDMVRSIGADYVIDYNEVDFTKAQKQYDLILDCVVNHSISDYMRVLTPNGRYVSVAFNMTALILGPLISMISGKKVRQAMHTPNANDLDYVKELIEAGKVKPIVANRFGLSETAEAFRAYGEKHPSGKTVISVFDENMG